MKLMNLVIAKWDGKYFLIDYNSQVTQSRGDIIATMGNPDIENYVDPYEIIDPLYYAKEIVKIVRESTKIPNPKICATCSHYDIEDDECEIRDIAKPTPPRKVSWDFGCQSWTE